jgi:hypothetical protein
MMSHEARLSSQQIQPAAFLRRGQLVTPTGNQVGVFNCVEWNHQTTHFSMLLLSLHDRGGFVSPAAILIVKLQR